MVVCLQGEAKLKARRLNTKYHQSSSISLPVSKKYLKALVPAKWDIVRDVLTGKDKKGISLSYAAEKAGVTTDCIRAWGRLSALKRDEDEPWIHEIAEVLQQCKQFAGNRLKDKMWSIAQEGKTTTTYDADGCLVGKVVADDFNAVKRLLEYLDPDFQKTSTESASININLDLRDVYERVQGSMAAKDALDGYNVAPPVADSGTVAPPPVAIQAEEVIDADFREEEGGQ